MINTKGNHKSCFFVVSIKNCNSIINVISKHICNKIANKKMYFCSAKTDKEYCMEKAV